MFKRILNSKVQNQITTTIGVRYSCAHCGLNRVTAQVPARVDEDVRVWFKKVMGRAIKNDHAARSPHCRSNHVTDVMIPMTGASKVGGPSEN